MEFLKVIFISVVQGVAEFLPVSSSGHIFLLKKILGLDFDMSFDITIHLGTLFSILIIYYRDIIELIRGVFSDNLHSHQFEGVSTRSGYIRVILLFVIATIPAAVAGFFLKDSFSEFFIIQNSKSFYFLAAFFFLTIFYLLLTRLPFKKSTILTKDMSFKDALIIGLFQMTAIFPGVSRAGSTLSASILRGLDKKEAGRFSFLMSVPLILAAFFLELKDMAGNTQFNIEFVLLYCTGFFVSFLTGYLTIKLLLLILQKGSLWIFAIYLIFPALLSLRIGFYN